MSKVVVSEFMTVDGVIEDPGGGETFDRGGWAFQFDRGPEGDRFKLDELMAAGAMLLGRVTYEGFAAAWPKMEGMGEFGKKMNGMPKYVVSKTLDRADWNNSTIVGHNVPEEVAKLKRAVDGDILVAGSAQLVRSLMEHDLVDEYRLMVYPIVLGSGKRLFTDSSKAASLRLVDAIKAGETMILTYNPTPTEAESS
jgi:dihydrofolate reductase